LQEIIKLIENKQLKEEVQKLIRVIQTKIMGTTRDIDFLLETSRIPIASNVNIPLIKEIESTTPLEEKVGFTKQMDEEKESKAYLPKKDYFNTNPKTNKTENFITSYTPKETQIFGEDEKESAYKAFNTEKQKTDKEPESYIVKDAESHRKKAKKFGELW
jgi:hypothetical protein